MKLLDRMRRQPPPMACQELVEHITDYLEGALSERDRRRFEAHLADCPLCTEYVRQFRAIIDTAGRVSAEELPPETREGLLAAFHGWAGQD